MLQNPGAIYIYTVVVSQSPSHVWLFVTAWTAARPLCPSFCPSPSPKLCPSSPPLRQWCRPAISSSNNFFCFQSFLASRTFPMSQLFTSGDQNTGVSASASVLPMNIQGWSPSRWTGLLSLQSKGLSGVFSNTTVQRHQLFGAPPSLQSSSHNHTWPLGRP